MRFHKESVFILSLSFDTIGRWVTGSALCGSHPTTTDALRECVGLISLFELGYRHDFRKLGRLFRWESGSKSAAWQIGVESIVSVMLTLPMKSMV
jgi:hypothetical protein